MSHQLHTKVQLSAIDDMKNWFYQDPDTRVMIVLDHKKNILNMKYHEGQVQFLGKGMSVLGKIIIEGVINVPNVKLRYKFVDYIVKGYTRQ